MTTFVIPDSARERVDAKPARCTANLDQKIRCELDVGHEPGDLHRNGPLRWHEPVQVYVGGELVDVTVESERWRDGQVVLHL